MGGRRWAAPLRRVIADARLWGENLTAVGSLGAEARAAIEAIEGRGVRAAVEALLPVAGA